MVLDRKDGKLPMLEPLNRSIVEVDVRDLESRRARDLSLAPLDREAVVL